MSFFKSDLIRSFAAGFVLGVVALVGTMGIGGEEERMVPAAIAAEAR